MVPSSAALHALERTAQASWTRQQLAVLHRRDRQPVGSWAAADSSWRSTLPPVTFIERQCSGPIPAFPNQGDQTVVWTSCSFGQLRQAAVPSRPLRGQRSCRWCFKAGSRIFDPRTNRQLGCPHTLFVGISHPVLGVLPSFPTLTPNPELGQDDCHQWPSEDTGTESGNLHLAGQGCYSACEPPARPQGHLHKAFSCPKENCGFMTSLGSQGPENISEGLTVSQVNHPGNIAGNLPGWLDHICRPHGRLFSCPTCSISLAFSMLRFPKQAFSVQGPTIWPFVATKF